jgi:hypothetical protein
MKQVIFLLTFVFAHISVRAQCFQPFLPLSCYQDTSHSLIAAYDFSRNRHISQWGWDQAYPEKYEKKMARLTQEEYKTPLDSLFRVARAILLETYGDKAFCERIQFEDITLYENRFNKITSGYFTFTLAKEEINCWNTPKVNIAFHFTEDAQKGLALENVPQFPDQDSFAGFLYANASDMLKNRLGDISTRTTRLRSKQMNYEEVELYESNFWREFSGCTINIKDGSSTDTSHYLSTYGSKEAQRAKAVPNSDLIVDAIGISVDGVENTNGNILHKLYRYKVLTLFKGTLLTDTIAILNLESTLHDRVLPLSEERAIFFLTDSLFDHRFSFKNPLPVLHEPVAGPYWVGVGDHYYQEIYPTITTLTEQAFTVINQPDYHFLKNPSFFIPAQESTGKEALKLTFKGCRVVNNGQAISGNVHIHSTKDLNVFLKTVLEIQYDTTLIVPFAVRNKVFHTQHQFNQDTLLEDCQLHHLLTNQNYQLEAVDINANTIQLTIEAMDTSATLREIGPANLNNHNRYNDTDWFFNFSFAIRPLAVLAKDQAYSIQLSSADTSWYQDKFTQQPVAYERIIIHRNQAQIDLLKQVPVITRVSPLNYNIGDTITITGINLATYQQEIFCPCEIVDQEILFKRHCPLPEKYIIDASFDKIRFIVPENFDFKEPFAPGFDDMLPSSGTLKIKYAQSREELKYTPN